MKMVFNGIGSDPEMLFGRAYRGELSIVPAGSVITNNKEIGLKSFIGIDAHPATAELRPPPAHNIQQHLYSIAVGVVAAHNYLNRKRKWDGVQLMATPWIHPEALGGHIHVSFFFDDPVAHMMMDTYNQIHHVGMLRPFDKEKSTHLPAIKYADKIQDYIKRAIAWETPTPEVVCRVLDHILLPFEFAVQPWSEREQRFDWCQNAPHYNHDADYLVRWVHSKRPARHPSLSYLHVEYRTPSTWLQHPWLAYAYFALTKLVMLNYDRARDLARSAPQTVVRLLKPGPMNDEYDRIFRERLGELCGTGIKRTPDLRDLERSLMICEENKEDWFGTKNGPIDVEAWRYLLP